MRKWAEAHGVDLRKSYAYSDSVYDTPLLSAVGKPFAVNPDPRMLLVALARRWPVIHLDVPPGVPKLPIARPRASADRAGAAPDPIAYPFARFDIAGIEHIPGQGPGDPRRQPPLLLRRAWRWRSWSPAADASVRFLGKKEVFDAPVIGQVAKAMGGIRVERASGSDEPLQRAAEALGAGQMVALMPQGTIPRGQGVLRPRAQAAAGARHGWRR